VISLLLLVVGVRFKTNLFVGVAVLFFVAWDSWFVAAARHFTGRNAEQLLSQVITSRTYISYFIPINGALVAIAMSLDRERLHTVNAILSTAGIPFWLLMSPFVISSVALLLFPVQLEQPHSGAPTPALKALFFSCFLFEKTIIFLFAHIALRIASTLAQP
jgi:hypothetical protein